MGKVKYDLINSYFLSLFAIYGLPKLEKPEAEAYFKLRELLTILLFVYSTAIANKGMYVRMLAHSISTNYPRKHNDKLKKMESKKATMVVQT